MSRRKLTPKEHRMWSRVAKSIRALDKPAVVAPATEPSPPPADTVIPAARRPHARPTATTDDLDRLIGGFASPRTAQAASQRLQPDPAIKPGSPADRGKEKKVRRGRVPYGSVLDLHGHTQDTGRSALLQFVAFHRGAGETSVLVITGKGREGEGILRRRFLEWIAEPDFRVHVSGFARANQKHGGDGAFYLFLKRLTV